MELTPATNTDAGPSPQSVEQTESNLDAFLKDTFKEVMGTADITVDKQLENCGCIFYDLEIVAQVPNPNEEFDPSLYYCKGWDDHAGMGISVLCVYDFVDRCYRIYMQDNLQEFAQLIADREVVAGYNTIHFDNLVVSANGIVVPAEKNYDLWHWIVASVNGRSGYSLDNVLKANRIAGKTGRGTDAPRLAQSGQWGTLINYCMQDVKKGVEVLRLVCADVLVDPVHGGYMSVKKPWEALNVDVENRLPF